MIDIHSHILPGLDDGSQSLEQSVAMLEVAAAAGTTDIVATPHANLEFTFDPGVIDEKIAELRAASPAGPRIHRGCDFHLIPENIEDALAHPEKYSINGKGYLLIEFSDLLIPKTTSEIFERMLRAGLVPIVTHPERNELLQRRMDEMAGWVASGCLMQVTGHSLLGRFGKAPRAAARELMRRGMVHFVASDAHDTQFRSPALDEARRYVAAAYGEPAAAVLFEQNPGAALIGAPWTSLPPVTPKSKWLSFLSGR
jgi:protein-tyrosine phosphatase